MSNTFRLTLVVLVPILILAVLAFAAEQRQGQEKISWRHDPTAALADAGAVGKPTLLYFTADWCPPCKVMQKTTWVDDEVAAAMSAFTPVRINIDLQSDIAAAQRIESIPTILIIDESGRELSRTVGLVEPEDLVRVLGRWQSTVLE